MPKIKCSLRSRSDRGPCSACKKSNKECTFLEVEPEDREEYEKKAQDERATEKAKRKAAKLAAKDSKGKGKAPTKKPSPKKTKRIVNKAQGEGARRKSFQLPKSPHLAASTDGIHHKLILTPFAHPIKFNHNPPEDGSDPCRFCKNPYFGIWGDGIKKVEIIPYGGRKGNVEVSGGHFAEHGTNTKMCTTCTYYRVRITTCRSHRIVPLQDVDPRSYSEEAIQNSFEAMLAGQRNEGGSLAMKTKWCTICTSVAEFHCTAPHKYSSKSFNKNSARVLADTVDPDFIGCGLYLCGVCNQTLERIEKSRSSTDQRKIVDVMLKLRKDELYIHKGDAIRADSEFLLTGGLMLSFLNTHIDVKKAAAMGRAMGKLTEKPKEKPKETLGEKSTDTQMETPQDTANPQ